MELRRGVISDVENILDLLMDLFSQEEEFEFDREMSKKSIIEILSDTLVGEILVAKQDAKVIGMITLLRTVSTALGQPVLLLEDMIVDKAYRNQGVGSKLIKYAKCIAVDLKCRRISLLSDHVNIDAHSFYEKNGFTRSKMVTFRCLI
jgi:GNAT superfamily N-acetyltransferase